MIQSSLLWKALNAGCGVEPLPVHWFSVVAEYLRFKTHPLTNVDPIMLFFLPRNINLYFLTERYRTAFVTHRTIQIFFLNRPERIFN